MGIFWFLISVSIIGLSATIMWWVLSNLLLLVKLLFILLAATWWMWMPGVLIFIIWILFW